MDSFSVLQHDYEGHIGKGKSRDRMYIREIVITERGAGRGIGGIPDRRF
jgi:hypothetical protein